MFRKTQKSPAAYAGDTMQQHPENRISNSSSSSNALFPPIHIQMEDRQHDQTHDHKQLDGETEHDPLPPAVDYTGVSPSARYQFRALARRALSYHRRQRITNACCLIIWPVLLVLLCFISSIVMGGDSGGGYNGLVGFCVNEANPLVDPVINLQKIPPPNAGSDKWALSWYLVSYTQSGSVLDPSPCVRWFGETYPSKAPYENVSADAASQPDSFYTPPPPKGWLRVREYQDGNIQPAFLLQKQFNQTVYYTTANAQVAQALGSFSSVSRSFDSATWPPTNASIVYNASAPGVTPGTGIFGAIPVRYANGQFRELVTLANGSQTDVLRYPFTAQTFLPLQNQAAIDQAIRNIVVQAARNSDPYTSSPSNTDLPFGAVSYDALDPAQSSLKMTMQFGQPPVSDYSGPPVSSGMRQMISMTQMTNAIVKTKYAAQYKISQGLRALPYEWSTDNNKGYYLNQMSSFLFPFGLSFLLPTFVSILVQEKEDRHRMMMAMNGLKPVSYYLAHYVEFMTMQLILSLFFCLTCVAISSQFILRTNPVIMVVLLVVWSHLQTTMAFVLATLFSRTRRATLVVYFFTAMSCIMSSLTSQIFSDGTPFAWFIHPSFSFFNILDMGILHASRVNGLYPLIWTDFAPGTTLFKCVMLLLGESIIFVLLTFYIDAVAPSEYGVQRPWHFPVSSLFKKHSAGQLHDPEAHLAPHQHATDPNSDNEDTLQGGDADVFAERDRVRTQYDPDKTPLIIQNLFHRYRGKVEPALRGMSFGVETNTVLGLLGPNGAGKSTLIHLLTGLYRPTSGTAYVAGANIRTDMSTVHAKIGVCPQHDILWGDLTVADHLLFYSRLRGIPPHLEQQAITFAIASVSLTMFRDRQVKGLSGGEKRRVSIAIALLGDNSVIFLDEPSTGLDPAVRRVIWDIINRVKINRTIVLTTHSMEEADILSDRIAIMTSGTLRCIGSSLHLKELYGSGFRLNISSKPGRLQEACESIEHQVLRGLSYKRIDKFTNATTFEFELQQQLHHQQEHQQAGSRGQLSRIFSYLSQPGLFPAIEDWGVSQTTLEDVFIKIVTQGDTALAMPSIVGP